jgi:ABC-2 type transport system ATP-binding protein
MTGGQSPIIQARGLVRRFGKLDAVRGVSFEVAGGEVFGFLGPNGAGKTTTIDMLCTLLRPTAGTAVINGFDVVRRRHDVRRSIGLVFQQPTLDEVLTAEQNLRFHAHAYGVPAHERQRRIHELLTMVELWDRRNDSVREFSGGMKRRLEIARGLLHHPHVLFLDEPTLGLDPQTRRRIWDYLTDLRSQRRLTIFLTTHYMDEAEHCDRIAIIDHGRIIALDSPGQLKRNVGGDLITITTPDGETVAALLRRTHGLSPVVSGNSVSFYVPAGEAFLPGFVRAFDQPLDAISLRRPTLDDVFLELTGREIRDGAGLSAAGRR